MARASSLSPLFLSRGSSVAHLVRLHIQARQAPSCCIWGWVREFLNHRISELGSASVSQSAGHSCLRRKEFIQGRSLIVNARSWCGHRVPGTNKFSRSLFLRLAHNTRFATNRHINSNVHLCILRWERESISVTGLLTSLIRCQSIWR